MRVLNTQQMREADRRTIDEIGIPSIVLMENAGRQAVAAMEAAFEELTTTHVGVVCGRGNNGGDGFVVARTLVQRGVETSVFLLGSVADVRGDARTNLEVLGRIGLTVVEITNAQEWELHFSELSQCELIVDARHRVRAMWVRQKAAVGGDRVAMRALVIKVRGVASGRVYNSVVATSDLACAINWCSGAGAVAAAVAAVVTPSLDTHGDRAVIASGGWSFGRSPSSIRCNRS